MAKKEKVATTGIDQRKLLCENLSFAASEAYKLLRANLQFTLAEVDKCPVIGFTSSIRGETKTTTSVNLSYTVAETGKKVLIIDGDMRLPNVAKSLQLEKTPGLSNVLAGLATFDEAVQTTDMLDNWYILPAGDVPPNPSELLGSDAMHKFITEIREKFDFVVIDLPPIGIVSDALVIAESIDGLVVVCRQDYTSRKLLNECMNQLAPLGEKILGIVMSDTHKNNKGYYYNKNKYKSYSKYYEYGYDNGYGYSKSRKKMAAKPAEEAEQSASESAETMAPKDEA